MHNKRKGFPAPFHYDDIRTFTVSQAKKPAQFKHYRLQQMNASQVSAADAFI
ncbi:hypothetical protein [Acinetobacter sp. TSRC1-2]|uniref:hypothetical protein n=1 Tax=unclassified Acinetobacter TaxID=196816 RepID=UPI003CECC65F